MYAEFLTMDFDDDAPPDLVDTTAGGLEEEEVTVKVPITIVTGNLTYHSLQQPKLTFSLRLSGCRENDTIKLHSYGPTWKENCCDYEWYVRK